MSTRPATRATVLALICALILPLGGCIKQDVDVVLKKDGSGTVTITMTLDVTKLEGLMKMAESMGGGEDDANDDLDFKKEAEKLEKEFDRPGMKLVSVKADEDTEKKTRSMVIKAEFTSLEALYRSGLIEDFEVSLVKNEDGSYTLTHTMVSDEEEEAPPGADADQAAEMVKPMLKPFLGDLQINRSLTLPGSVLGSNGDVKVSWKLAFDDLFVKEKRTQKITFSGKDITLKPFKLKWADIKDQFEDEDEDAEEAAPEKEDGDK